jgi:hypothetical protein
MNVWVLCDGISSQSPKLFTTRIKAKRYAEEYYKRWIPDGRLSWTGKVDQVMWDANIDWPTLFKVEKVEVL